MHTIHTTKKLNRELSTVLECESQLQGHSAQFAYAPAVPLVYRNVHFECRSGPVDKISSWLSRLPGTISGVIYQSGSGTFI